MNRKAVILLLGAALAMSKTRFLILGGCSETGFFSNLSVSNQDFCKNPVSN
jgi:hypothetical protein